jgi:acetyl-CoA carboxylase biotin carboxyl carrier protein
MAGKKKFEVDPTDPRTGPGNLIDVDSIRQLLEVLERSDVTRLSWRRGPERLVIQRGPAPAAVVVAASHPAPAHPPPSPPNPSTGSSGPRVAAPEPPPAPAAEKPGVLVVSPFVGTFYRAAGPDQPVFAETGAVVKKGQTLCIIEAMKLMNEIESEVAGKVTEILAENGQPVEFGQALFRIEPL